MALGGRVVDELGAKLVAVVASDEQVEGARRETTEPIPLVPGVRDGGVPMTFLINVLIVHKRHLLRARSRADGMTRSCMSDNRVNYCSIASDTYRSESTT